MSDSDQSNHLIKINTSPLHNYAVTLAYHADDIHMQERIGDNGKLFTWAELEDHKRVVFRYEVQANSIRAAIDEALRVDDARKAEIVASWPSALEEMPVDTAEHLEVFYNFLLQREYISNWIFTDPTTVSAVIEDMEQQIHTDMENAFIQRNDSFLRDVANWANKEEE